MSTSPQARPCAAVFSLIMPAVTTRTIYQFGPIDCAWRFFEHGEIQGIMQLQVGVLAVGAMRFEVVNFGEYAAKPADEDLLAL